MRNAHLYRCMVSLIFISVTLSVSLQQTPQQVRMEQDPLARTRKHIVDCVEPLCREVLPRENKLLFLATPVASTSERSRGPQVWTVDCLDARNEQRLRLILKAQSVTVCLNAGSDDLRFVYVNSVAPGHSCSAFACVPSVLSWLE